MDLFTLTARQHIFSTSQARERGLTHRELRRREERGDVLHLGHGWWAERPPRAIELPWKGPTTHETATRTHLLRCVALLRHFDGRALPSHESALVLHGLPAHGCDLATVHLSRTVGAARRHTAGVVVHAKPDAEPSPFVAPSPGFHLCGPRSHTTNLALSIVRAGLGNRPETALVAADSALHRGLLKIDQLERGLAQCSRSTGIGAVRRVLSIVDGRRESPGESLTSLVLHDLGWSVLPQAVLRTAAGTYRVDFLLHGEPVIIEFDGAVKYAGAGGHEALMAEKRREDALREAGYEVVRLVWSDLDQPSRIDEQIRRAVRRAQARGRSTA